MNFGTLNLIFRFNKEFSHERIRMKGLSDTEYMISTFICSHANCSQEEVATSLRMDKTTVGKALLTLEEKGIVVRTMADDDKRKKCLRITEKGYSGLADLMDIHDEWLSRVLNCLTSDEQRQFENYCERLLHEAEKIAAEKEDGETTNAQ